MRAVRTNAIAAALVFFELMATQAMAEPIDLTTLDINSCRDAGGWHACPRKVEPSNTAAVKSWVILPGKVFEDFKTAPAPTQNDIEALKKKLEATPAPDSTK